MTKHIAEPQQVVSRVNVEVDGKPSNDNTLALAVGQHPYHRTFGFFPLSTLLWHNDSTHWYTRLRAKLGTEPPVYDPFMTLRSEKAMQRAMINKGYLGAEVTSDTTVHKRKVTVNYRVDAGVPHRIASYKLLLVDPSSHMNQLLERDRAAGHSNIKEGGLLDRTRLEAERTRITALLRNNGYYDFNKEDISFVADTLAGSYDVDLSMFAQRLHERYVIRSVRFVPNYDLVSGEAVGDSDYIKPQVLEEKCLI
ncbi:MAG: POTRA domain-containing protein, partial [Bacteroidales bacterium]|nr:POTRA domain-containing protein [Bacteroidales bacterium]